MRTSSGFLVTGVSGKILIHSFPPRLTARVMARRAASIWRAVSRPSSVLFRPNSPKLTLLPVSARPRLRPFICLRYFVLLGCIMAVGLRPLSRGLGRFILLLVGLVLRLGLKHLAVEH